MASVYEFIGRTVVRVVWWRLGRQIQIVGLAALLTAGGIGFLLSRRNPPEG